MSDYLSNNAINWSSLKHMAKSPLEYKWRTEHQEPRKTAYILGGAIHCLVLEPDKFDDRYALCSVRRNKRDSAFKEWTEEHPTQEPLNPGEYEHANKSAGAVLRHPVAKSILEPCRYEEPLVWADPDTGLKCKGRLDGIGQYVVDLKTSQDPSPHKFTRDAATFMYHGQLSHYHTGAATLRKIDGKTTPYIIACAKEPPYDVAVYAMKHDDLHAGRLLCLSLMRKLEECIASDLWPGCAPDLQYLELPPWSAGLRDEETEIW